MSCATNANMAAETAAEEGTFFRELYLESALSDAVNDPG